MPSRDELLATLRAALEVVPDAMIVVDNEGVILLANTGVTQLFGFPAEQLIGSAVEMLVPERSRSVHALHRATYSSSPRTRAMGSGIELFGRRSDATEFPVDISLRPLESPTGMLVVATIRDISDRRQLERAIRDTEHKAAEAVQESESRFRLLAENAMDIITLCEADTTFKYVSPSCGPILGYEPGELIGRTVHEFLHPEDRALVAATEREARSSGRPGTYDRIFRFRRKDGGYSWLEARARTVIDQHTRDVRELITVSRDVTKRVETEQRIARLNQELSDRIAELKAANEELEAFTYSVSHDLKGPLRAVDALAQALAEDYTGKVLEGEALDDLRMMRASTTRMRQLIDDLLTFSRASRTVLRKEAVDLAAIAREVGEEMFRRSPERHVEFIVPDKAMVEADAGLVRIAMDNLLNNAWKFTSKTTRARIEFGKTGDGEPAFFVRDNGAGFESKKANRLFRPFQRLHTAAEFEGTGIGLATVRRIIERQGGRIWAEGEPGQGATFWFVLEAPENARSP